MENTHTNRKVIVYIAASLDGYIAKPGDDLSFLSIVEKEGEDYGYQSFMQHIDTVIIGRRTYDWVLTQVPEFPHKDLQTFVITHAVRPSEGNVNFYNGSLRALVADLKSQKGKHVFVDGGAAVIHELLKEQLVDEMYVSIIPILLGAGTSLFNEGFPEQRLGLMSARPFDTGLVQLHYQVLRT